MEINLESAKDVFVNIKLTAKKAGWFSMASPTLATLPETELGWGLVPGYFQGNRLEEDWVLSVAHAQGLPDFPYICGDRTVTTPTAILQNNKKRTFAVILEPGQTREIWAKNNRRPTHRNVRAGVSHMNRQGELSPTVYAPVLNHPDAQLKVGDTISLRFRYRLADEGWFEALQYAMDEVYKTTASLSLKKNKQFLTTRVKRLFEYSLDDNTSRWQEARSEGLELGAQSYMGQVMGSYGDAVKNSDIGAMWMMRALTDNQELAERRLPRVRNFKLLQQESSQGFFHGAARGQYYLTKSDRWVEEWGSHIEPTGVTYYTLADLGNILFFEPNDAQVKAAFRVGAERLLTWQQTDGSWQVGYDHKSKKPVYTDLKDLRPTFYGLAMAYRILNEQKYLTAAKKGADWLIENAVDQGCFLGVCGDHRFVNDFATAQISQALLDLWELTKEEKYKLAAIKAARMYVYSIYAHPVPNNTPLKVGKQSLQGWQYTHAGLGFEHGGSIGSANNGGPILLASHTGMFVRIAQITGNPFFAELARAAVWGRDAHVNSKTSVASYYWHTMDRGAGPFPHHAWWQIGWLMDYLLAEADYRSKGQIQFPAGFMTAKVGPHQPYGFADGVIFGVRAQLIFNPDTVKGLFSSTDLLMAKSTQGTSVYLIFLQNDTDVVELSLQVDIPALVGTSEATYGIWDAQKSSFSKMQKSSRNLELAIAGKGIQVVKISK